MYSSNLPLVVYSRFVRPTYHGFARSEVMDLCVTRRIGRVGQVEVQWFGRYSKSTLCVEIKGASCLLGSLGRQPSIGDCSHPTRLLPVPLGKTPKISYNFLEQTPIIPSQYRTFYPLGGKKELGANISQNTDWAQHGRASKRENSSWFKKC